MEEEQPDLLLPSDLVIDEDGTKSPENSSSSTKEQDEAEIHSSSISSPQSQSQSLTIDEGKSEIFTLMHFIFMAGKLAINQSERKQESAFKFKCSWVKLF